MPQPEEPFLPIPYGRQDITEADIHAVIAALKDDFITQGPRITAFEEAFAAHVGAPYAVAVSSGTAALHLSALALGVAAGTRVITTANTFVADANCVLYCGGEIDFADIHPDTYCLDIEAVRRKLEAAPKGHYHGLIVVDFAGLAADLGAWRALADEHGLWLIEDACHALGAKSPSHTPGDGTFADLTTFSFHPVKHITTGEGGMITTAREDLYHRLLQLRNHGITKDPSLLQENHGGWYYELQSLGFNYRITDIQCALGKAQLTRAAAYLRRRQELAARYDAAFAGHPRIRPPHVPRGYSHAYHLYVVQTPDRKGLYDYLRTQGIYTQVHYIPVHLQPYYRALGWERGQLPHTEAYYTQCLSLPLYPGLSEQQQAYVIEKVLGFDNHCY